MQCKNCFFSLLCYSGMFNSLKHSNSYSASLCPTCERLVCWNKHGTTVFTFFCEKRVCTEEVWAIHNKKIGGLRSGINFINDPVAKSVNRLCIVSCFKCRAQNKAVVYETARWLKRINFIMGANFTTKQYLQYTEYKKHTKNRIAISTDTAKDINWIELE